MAKILENLPNATAPDATEPFGNILDKVGATPGTPVNKETVSDFYQFFARLPGLLGRTYNDLPENAVNGFEMVDMLAEFITARSNTVMIAETAAAAVAPIAAVATIAAVAPVVALLLCCHYVLQLL